jgi:SAM-dependent methyltransferase
MDSIHRLNQVAWDRVARPRYEREVEEDVLALRGGGNGFLPFERRVLTELAPRCQRAIHLQCSHGFDALALWKLGAREVVGVDISAAMLALAGRKAELLEAPAVWVHADVLETPHILDATADLVYTGKGALPWIMDLARWALVAARLLRPGGRLYLVEGHPLDWVWEHKSRSYRLSEDGSGYFDTAPRTNATFPGIALANLTPSNETAPPALERQWSLGAVVTAVIEAGLVLERVEEHPEPFWPAFPNIPEDTLRRLPHTYSLLARKPA